MNDILCLLAEAVNWLVWLYTILLFVYAVVSWIPDLRGRWVYSLGRLIEPVLQPVRKVIPPLGGLDLAFLVVILVLQFVIRPLITHAMISTCALLGG